MNLVKPQNSQQGQDLAAVYPENGSPNVLWHMGNTFAGKSAKERNWVPISAARLSPPSAHPTQVFRRVDHHVWRIPSSSQLA